MNICFVTGSIIESPMTTLTCNRYLCFKCELGHDNFKAKDELFYT